jgi:outer membrane protein assembly factor BamD
MRKTTLLIPALLLIIMFTGCTTTNEHTPEYAYATNLGKRAALTPPHAAIVLMDEANTAHDQQKYGKALDLYKKIWTDYEDTSIAPEALFQAGLIYKERHQYAKAFDRFNQILGNYPSYPRFNEVINEEFAIASALMEGNRPYIFGVVPGFKNYKDAIKYFEGVVDNAPSSEYAPIALMNIALIAGKNNDDEEAIDALERLVDNYPSNLLTPTAYLMLAKTYANLVQGPAYDQGATQEAIRYYQDFLLRYPTNEHVPEAEAGLAKMNDIYARNRKELGDFYYSRRNNNEAALIFYNEAITFNPDSQAAKESEIMLAKIDDGVKPTRTWVDFVLGPYKRKSLKQYQEDESIEHYDSERFQLESTEILLSDQNDTEWVQQSFAPDQDSTEDEEASINPFDQLEPLSPVFNEFPLDLPTSDDDSKVNEENWAGEHAY